MQTIQDDNIFVTIERFVDGRPIKATKVLSVTQAQASNFKLVRMTAERLFQQVMNEPPPQRRLHRDHGGLCECGDPDDPKLWHRAAVNGGCYAPEPIRIVPTR
jgi:hypothetical protein